MSVHAIVLPGGGYRTHAPHEAEPIAAWLSRLGVTSSVFRYPVGMRHPVAHEAIQDRIVRVRSEGAERILLVGFSAGGHAAGLAALAPRVGAEVDAAILGYPVVSMLSHVHEGSATTLTGGEGADELRRQLSLETRVSDDAPPMFLFHALDDAKVPAEHSARLSAALRARGRPHELHLFSSGGHGFGLGGAGQRWRPLAEDWLAGLGVTSRVT